MADVALVVGADTAPKGFFGPLPGERPEDPDWLRFHVLGATNPTYFALYARRRMELYGATTKDFSAVKVKNSRHGMANPNARYRKEFTDDEIAESPVVADPLRLVDICATSDGAAAVVLASAEFAASSRRPRRAKVEVAAISTVTPSYPNTYLDMPDIATDSGVGAPRPSRGRSATRSRTPRTRKPGLGPDDLSCAEVYDLSTALELDWYENIGLCAPGEAEALLHSGATDARRAHPGQPERWAGVRSARRSRRRPSRRCASSPGSCAARPATARSRARTSASRSTRVCSATVAARSSRAETFLLARE